jgi:hypothetical protein
MVESELKDPSRREVCGGRVLSACAYIYGFDAGSLPDVVCSNGWAFTSSDQGGQQATAKACPGGRPQWCNACRICERIDNTWAEGYHSAQKRLLLRFFGAVEAATGQSRYVDVRTAVEGKSGGIIFAAVDSTV